MKKWEFRYYRVKEAFTNMKDENKSFIWGTIFGCVLMYVLLTFVLKDAQYFKGQRDGIKDLSTTIIVKLAK